MGCNRKITTQIDLWGAGPPARDKEPVPEVIVTHDSGTAVSATRVDFTAPAGAGALIFERRLQASAITLVRCRTRPNPLGGQIVSPQTTVVVPAGPAFELDWQHPEGGPKRSTTIGRGRAMVYEANRPIWKRWSGSPPILIMALAPASLAQICEQEFGPHRAHNLRTYVGLDDPTVDSLMRMAERELAEGGPHGRLFLEGLAMLISVHLLQSEGNEPPIPWRHGALAPASLRLVTDYMEAHLAEELPLASLAALAALSPHHFGQAFKAATGVPPHQYVIRLRVARARELLRDPRLTVADAAIAVGFSNQSHLTQHFRRLTGTTPARFRRERR